jgi:hypothetical protein
VFGESDVADNLEEASENFAAIFNLCRGKELLCDTKDFLRSDDHFATHYSSEPATALLVVEGGEAAAGEQDIST